MKIESGLLASQEVLASIESAYGNSLKRMDPLRLGDYVVTGAIGQVDITQDDVEILRLDNLQGCLLAISGRDFVSDFC